MNTNMNIVGQSVLAQQPVSPRATGQSMGASQSMGAGHNPTNFVGGNANSTMFNQNQGFGGGIQGVGSAAPFAQQMMAGSQMTNPEAFGSPNRFFSQGSSAVSGFEGQHRTSVCTSPASNCHESDIESSQEIRKPWKDFLGGLSHVGNVLETLRNAPGDTVATQNCGLVDASRSAVSASLARRSIREGFGHIPSPGQALSAARIGTKTAFRKSQPRGAMSNDCSRKTRVVGCQNISVKLCRPAVNRPHKLDRTIKSLARPKHSDRFLKERRNDVDCITYHACDRTEPIEKFFEGSHKMHFGGGSHLAGGSMQGYGNTGSTSGLMSFGNQPGQGHGIGAPQDGLAGGMSGGNNVSSARASNMGGVAGDNFGRTNMGGDNLAGGTMGRQSFGGSMGMNHFATGMASNAFGSGASGNNFHAGMGGGFVDGNGGSGGIGGVGAQSIAFLICMDASQL